MPTQSGHDYGPRRISVELTNVCNLHCSYCLRDEDALYHARADFFDVELLRRVLAGAREAAGVTHVSFTGGEVTLHPRFGEVLDTVAGEGLTAGFVTNGWHFERVWPAVAARREAITNVAFSLDGATREAHDRWRGGGSFVRLVRAFTRCREAGLPFNIKATLRRDNLPQLEQFALFAARMGASGLSFAHVLPTSAGAEAETALGPEERDEAEREVATLARIFRMPVRLDVGYYNADPAPPCAPLAGVSCNVDYRGFLSLCCNLSGYRGAAGEADVVADLRAEPFAAAYARLLRVAELQNERRARALAELAARGERPGLDTGSPCLFCLHTFDKVPWRKPAGASAGRSLPVMQKAVVSRQ
ncbi:MAG TPA: radical SAM protein [Pyrinomonadaceae bacterium]|nr:radical SAM protein [Pyrinomonadaceae bacterium]